MERVRAVTHYIVFPTELADTPIPMERFKYQPVDEEGEATGEETFYTANQLQPKARHSVDGSKMVLGLELSDIFGAVAELAQFPHKDQLQVLSHKETVELMQTEEWTSNETTTV